MTVATPFEEKYRFSKDPWKALDPKQAVYYAWLQGAIAAEVKSKPARILDIGCGEGHFTNRLACELNADEAVGVDIAPTALERARTNYPDCRFEFADFGARITDLGTFDVINCSQVIYYLSAEGIGSLFQNIYSSLTDNGIVAITATCLGGDYLEPDEFFAICGGGFETLHVGEQGTHRLFIGRKRACQVAVTIDYELYHLPQTINAIAVRSDVIDPTEAIMAACERAGARLTIFAEMGEYRFFQRHAPDVADLMRTQWRDAVKRGHDVQVHIHSRWLSEGGATADEKGSVRLALDNSRIHNFDGATLREIVSDIKRHLEEVLRPVNDDYRAVCYRAGKYQIQPIDDVFRALRDSGLTADSSVWQGGYLGVYDGQPGFDFRTLWHRTRPYWPNPVNINRPVSRDSADGVIELPILSENGMQWSFDVLGSDALCEMFERNTAGGGVRIMIGHSYAPKADRVEQLEAALVEMKSRGATFITLREKVADLQTDEVLAREVDGLVQYGRRSRGDIKDLLDSLSIRQRRTIDALAAEVRKVAASRVGPIRLLDVGCGTGEFLTFPLLSSLQDLKELEVLAIDRHTGSIEHARDRAATYTLPQLTFECAELESIDKTFDVVVCSDVVDHAGDTGAFVRALTERVAPNGTLLIVSANGHGYEQTERRAIRKVYNALITSPMAVRHAAVNVKRTFGRLKSRPAAVTTPVRLVGTLAFAEDSNRRPLRLRSLRKMLAMAGFGRIAVTNTHPLGGVAGSRIDRALRLQATVHRWPSAWAAGWMIVARRH